MRYLKLAFVLVICLAANNPQDPPSGGTYHIVGDSKDSFENIYQEGLDLGGFYYEEVVEELLPHFQGIPYGTGGAGCPADKTLINFSSFDCVTFVESFWAISFTLYEYHNGLVHFPDHFEIFARNVDKIRYFGEENCGVEDRIHYFTQAMQVLQRRGLVFNVARANGKIFEKKINYMTGTYGLTYNLESMAKMRSLETILTEANDYFYPLSDIGLYLPLAKDGDIVALATNRKGLDVSHTGIITVDEGEVYMTHASSVYNKVVHEQNLMDYINSRSTVTGIFVYRPVFP